MPTVPVQLDNVADKADTLTAALAALTNYASKADTGKRRWLVLDATLNALADVRAGWSE
jgi:hypothetical protein